MIKVFILTLMFVFTSSAYAGKFNEKEIRCLSLNAYHEARSEGEKGMLATIFVVLNRTKDRRFPSTPCKVIAQPNQFEWWGKGKTIKEPEMYDKAKELVYEVLDGKHKDFTRGSIYFNAHHKAPKGTMCTIRIGNHSFYREVKK
jgi:spore germination cell wall hydrolase CwlJ-like protein